MAIAPTSLDLRRPRISPIPVLRMHPAFLVAQLVLLAAALGLTALAKANPGPLPGDVGITLAWQQLVRPHSLPTEAIGAVSTINFPRPARYLTIAVVVALLLCRRWFDVALALTTLGIAGTSTKYVNLFVERPRPEGHDIFVNRYIADVFSFPSGHVGHALVFMGIVTFFTFRVRNPGPWLTAALWLVRIYLLAQVILMAPSRVLEGEHWPSDVLGGLLFGGFWLLAGIQIYFLVTGRWPQLIPQNERADALAGH